MQTISRYPVKFGPIPVTPTRREDLAFLTDGSVWSGNGTPATGCWVRDGDYAYGPFHSPPEARAFVKFDRTGERLANEPAGLTPVYVLDPQTLELCKVVKKDGDTWTVLSPLGKNVEYEVEVDAVSVVYLRP